MEHRHSSVATDNPASGHCRAIRSVRRQFHTGRSSANSSLRPTGRHARMDKRGRWLGCAHRRHGDPQTPHDHYHRTRRHYSVKYILTGRVVTMDADRKVLRSGAVYVDGKTVAAVAKADDPVLAGFETAPKVNTKGIILPGLIELHNHLS